MHTPNARAPFGFVCVCFFFGTPKWWLWIASKSESIIIIVMYIESFSPLFYASLSGELNITNDYMINRMILSLSKKTVTTTTQRSITFRSFFVFIKMKFHLTLFLGLSHHIASPKHSSILVTKTHQTLFGRDVFAAGNRPQSDWEENKTTLEKWHRTNIQIIYRTERTRFLSWAESNIEY